MASYFGNKDQKSSFREQKHLIVRGSPHGHVVTKTVPTSDHHHPSLVGRVDVPLTII